MATGKQPEPDQPDTPDLPDPAFEEGDSSETGRMQGHIMEDDPPLSQKGDDSLEHWESGRRNANPDASRD